MVTFTGNSIGDTATYTCDLGFELIGPATATCTAVDANSAEFSPPPPVCRREYTALITLWSGYVVGKPSMNITCLYMYTQFFQSMSILVCKHTVYTQYTTLGGSELTCTSILLCSTVS